MTNIKQKYVLGLVIFTRMMQLSEESVLLGDLVHLLDPLVDNYSFQILVGCLL